MSSEVASTSSGSQPNTSLYIKNLNTKTKKPELRRQLYSLFSTYGKVIDIVATRADGMRGRAFVVFRDLSSATAARRALNGFDFYDRSLSIEYANSQSKATILLEKGPEALFDGSLLNGSSSKTNKVTVSSAQADQRGREKKRQREEAKQRGEKVDDDDDEEEEENDDGSDEDDGPKMKSRKVEADEVKQDATEATAVAEEEEEEEEETAMDMASSDSEDEEASPGPAPPP